MNVFECRFTFCINLKYHLVSNDIVMHQTKQNASFLNQTQLKEAMFNQQI